MSSRRLAVATYPFPSRSDVGRATLQCHSLRLAVRQKADCGGIHESHILQVKSDLRVAALHLLAQFEEIFLSLPATAGPDGALQMRSKLFPGIGSVFAGRPQHVERWRIAVRRCPLGTRVAARGYHNRRLVPWTAIS